MKIKNVLLLSKRSAYTFYFVNHDVTKGRKGSEIIKRSRELFKAAHDEHYATLALVKGVLHKYDIPYVSAYRGRKVNYKDFDLIITVGGDGTFLEAAHWVVDQKILGVNSAITFSVGRFCQANKNNFEDIIKGVLINKLPVRLVRRLKLTVDKKVHSMPILNEVLICHQNPAFLCRYQIKIGKDKEEHRGSGLWVAAPSGTSGAIFSAGGKILDQFDNRFEYVARELYAKDIKKYRLQLGILPAKQSVQITSMMRSGVIYFDGPHHRLPFGFGAVAKIDLTAKPLKIFDC